MSNCFETSLTFESDPHCLSRRRSRRSQRAKRRYFNVSINKRRKARRVKAQTNKKAKRVTVKIDSSLCQQSRTTFSELGSDVSQVNNDVIVIDDEDGVEKVKNDNLLKFNIRKELIVADNTNIGANNYLDKNITINQKGSRHSKRLKRLHSLFLSETHKPICSKAQTGKEHLAVTVESDSSLYQQLRSKKLKLDSDISSIEDVDYVKDLTINNLTNNVCNAKQLNREGFKEIITDDTSSTLRNCLDKSIIIVDDEDSHSQEKQSRRSKCSKELGRFSKRNKSECIDSETVKAYTVETDSRLCQYQQTKDLKSNHDIITIIDDEDDVKDVTINNCLSNTQLTEKEGISTNSSNVTLGTCLDKSVVIVEDKNNQSHRRQSKRLRRSKRHLSVNQRWKSKCNKVQAGKKCDSVTDDDVILIENEVLMISDDEDYVINAINNNANSNIYNTKPIKRQGLKEIVIDGTSVALESTCGLVFSVEVLRNAIDYFAVRGHKVKAFIPQFRVRKNQSSNQTLLHRLVKNNYVITTPSRMVNKQLITSNDARYIIQYATHCEGIIVSNNDFKQEALENPEWRRTIETSLLKFTWNRKNKLTFPKKPLGSSGPSLINFLRFS